MTVRRLSVPGKDRLDKELAAGLGIARDAAKRMILAGRIRFEGGTRHHPARRLGCAADLEILDPAPSKRPPAAESALDLKIEVVFEDPFLLAVNKPEGIPVHPGAGHDRGTLVDLLQTRGVPLADLPNAAREGLVHRLDKDTSGILLVAKDVSVGEALMRQFAERNVEKEYRAVVMGRVPERPLRIVGAIGRDPRNRKKLTVRRGGRSAVTVVDLLEVSGGASLVRILPETGRTHQIRVHLSHAGFPILGDPLYGRAPSARGVARRMLLHAYRLKFQHPKTRTWLDLTAPLPESFVIALRSLGFSPA